MVFAGRIQKLKGPQVLVAAAADLATRRPDIPLQLSILGSGSGAEALRLQPLIDDAGLQGRVSALPAGTSQPAGALVPRSRARCDAVLQ